MIRKAVVLVGVLVFLAAPAMAGFSAGSLVTEYTDVSGDHWLINGTDITLFEPVSPYSPSGPGDDLWSNNNMSPVDYPGVSPSYVPSPGNRYDYAIGERSDLEGLFFDYNASSGNLKVRLVSSTGPDGFTYRNCAYHLGDVFLSVDGGAWDYALLGFGAMPGLAGDHAVWSDLVHAPWGTSNDREAGSLATLDGDSVLYGINGPHSWAGNSSIASLVGPWAVNNPDIAYGNDLVYQEILDSSGITERDFASGPPGYPPSGDNHNTYVYLWDVMLPEVGLDPLAFDFHVTLQCGNDLLNGGSPGGGNQVPLPGALVMGLVGVALVNVLGRKRFF